MPTPPEAGPQAGHEGPDMGAADYMQFRPLMV